MVTLTANDELQGVADEARTLLAAALENLNT